MTAYVQNLLAFHANNVSLGVLPVLASVLRTAREAKFATLARAAAIKNQITLRLLMLRQSFTYGKLALAGLWTALELHDVPQRAPQAVARAIEPVRLTLEDHWRRATSVIASSIASFERVKTLQAAAAQQLDAADYALAQLIHDLRPAMALPSDVTGLRAILAEAERSAPVRVRKAALAA